VDTAGNVYCGGSGGLWIMDPTGKKLGRIVHGASATTNLAFGGDDWKTLFFTTRGELGSVRVKIPGIPVPATKR
jgi:gluconolactonase